jgi:molecular chaperone HtpG
VKSLLALFEKSPADERVEAFAQLLYGQAVIAEGSKIEDVGGFTRRLNELMVRAAG